MNTVWQKQQKVAEYQVFVVVDGAQQFECK